MMFSVRGVLSGLAVVFTAYLALGGMLWTAPVQQPVVYIATVVFYVVTVCLCIFWRTRPPVGVGGGDVAASFATHDLLPAWAGVLALLSAVIVPNTTWYAAGRDISDAQFVTWTTGAIGALMTIVMVRRRPVIAWTGVILVAASACIWLGVADALAYGTVGNVVWVGVAQLLTRLMATAARDTSALLDQQRVATEWIASQEVRRRERRIQVQRALAVAGPVLVRTIEAGGELDEDERREARLAEGRLRDELRGRILLDDDVRARVDAARLRGTHVTLLDEGGLDGLDDAALGRIRAELAGALDGATSDRIYVRSSAHERVAVTVVGRTNSAHGEDDVDVWREIERPA